MNAFKRIISGVIMAGIVAISAGSAYAQEDKPLIVVRFNNELMEYEYSVTKVVKSALAIRPDVFFDVVSIVPETPDAKQNKILHKDAAYKTQTIVEIIRKAGAPKDHIRITYQDSKLVPNTEVDVFVQ